MTAFLGNILGSLLKFVYDMVSRMGVEPAGFSYYAMAIIITTIIFKLILLPLTFSQVKSSKKMAELQPLTQEIQDKYKNDPQTMQIKLQALYKEHNYNPASGCLMLLVQMPIIFAFFAVFREPAKYAFTEPGFYESMNKTFLWIANLELVDPFLYGMPLLAAATTYVLQSTTVQPSSNAQAASTMRTMNIMMPIMIFFAAKNFPAGLALYWVIGNIFTVMQNLITKRGIRKVKEER